MPRRPGRSRALPAAVVAAIVGVTSLVSSQTRPALDVTELTIGELQDHMRSGRMTARAITQQYLDRIDALDRNGPHLRAVIEVNPDALEIAAKRDAERRSGRVRGPLHGVPVLIKDNIATGDRMLTTAGSLALATGPAPRDATLVQRLREAGAVLLGKTNLSEWANFRSSHSSSGWSARGGQTRNAYAANRNPSGSSSGSAVAVAASLAAVAVGTETDGSIVSPASVNGVVGLKPTLGLVSRTGIVPIAHSQDTAGPIARTVADAALLLTAMAAPDGTDPATISARPPTVDFTAALDANGLRGARIGVVRNHFFGNHAAVDALADAAVATLQARGAVIVDPVTIETLGTFEDDEFGVLLHEFKHDLPRFFAWWGRTTPLQTLDDVIAFNRRNAERELAHFGQELFELADAQPPLTSPAYRDALSRIQRLTRQDGIDKALRTHRLDALVAPTGGPAWVLDTANGDSGSAFAPSPSSIAAVAGYPHVTVPMGHVAGLPVGLSFLASAWSDARLITFAYAYEQATRHRRPPVYR